MKVGYRVAGQRIETNSCCQDPTGPGWIWMGLIGTANANVRARAKARTKAKAKRKRRRYTNATPTRT